jgi:hypothetical protein
MYCMLRNTFVYLSQIKSNQANMFFKAMIETVFHQVPDRSLYYRLKVWKPRASEVLKVHQWWLVQRWANETFYL